MLLQGFPIENPLRRTGLFAYFCKNFAVSQFHSLVISDIQQNTPNAITLTFSIPDALRETFQFKAGQYITIRHLAGEEEIRRAYSICNPPSEAGSLSVGIKKVPDGTFSVYANTALKIGDSLEVMPPQGRFIFLPAESPKTIMAVAAGSGITPIMSIVQTALESHPENQVVLLYGNQGPGETMFYDALNDLQASHPERLHIYYSFSRQTQTGALFGRIDAAKVNYLVKNKFSGTQFDAYYICGPEPMIDVVKERLAEIGVQQEKVYFELFTEPEDKTDPTSVIQEGMTHVTIILDEEEFELDMARKERVLDAALNADIDAPYSCQGGVCSTCIARIKEGSVVMEKNQILTDGEIADGFILTCQSHPTSPRLVIDYDDV